MFACARVSAVLACMRFKCLSYSCVLVYARVCLLCVFVFVLCLVLVACVCVVPGLRLFGFGCVRVVCLW